MIGRILGAALLALVAYGLGVSAGTRTARATLAGDAHPSPASLDTPPPDDPPSS